MLTSGMVPALHNDEEKEQIIGQVCYHDHVYLFHIVVIFVRLLQVQQ